ncbi:hypothetical protein FGRMN_11149 [Fusarium graminum]|nr:hypothetical protein FGRMN_11149 [Fusarium graminum]
MVVKKVVESTYLHVANAGLVGSDEECPKLPTEFDWACQDGHNIEAYHMAVLIKSISQATHEIVVQSKYFLTNVILWMLWHYSGRFRVVVSGKVVFDRVLGSDERTVECRLTLFYVMENISQSLHLLFRGEYDAADDKVRTGLCVRQKLYEWPHRYPKDHKSTQTKARVVAKALMKWFLKLPVESASADLFPTTMVFDVLKSVNKSPSTCVVFSEEHSHDSDEAHVLMLGYDNEDLIRAILGFFPILQDLVHDMKKTCECHECQSLFEVDDQHGLADTFNHDTNYLGYLALSEAMFYIAHGVADAFGSPDASGIPSLSASLESDLGALEILGDIIRDEQGTVRWDTMFSTAVHIFLGARPPDVVPRSRHQPELHRFGSSGVVGSDIPTAVAVHYGSLAVIAPWLDISRPLNCRRSFRFEVVRGRLAFCSTPGDGQPNIRGLSGDLCVVETQRTEDIENDGSEEKWDWILVPVNETRQKVLLRIVSGGISRMVQPSMAIRQLARMIEAPPCDHEFTGAGAVPDKSLVELNTFEELLGRWGDPMSDDDTDYDTDLEDEKQRPRLPPRKRSRTTLGPKSLKRAMNKPTQVCASLFLDSSLKFNTALALAGMGPVIVNDEACCLKRSLQLAVDSKDKNRDFMMKGVSNPGRRWVICKKSSTMERLPLPLLTRRAIAR